MQQAHDIHVPLWLSHYADSRVSHAIRRRFFTLTGPSSTMHSLGTKPSS